MNSKKSKTSNPNRLLINLKRSGKYVPLPNLSIYYSCESVKQSYKNNKFKISAPTWNEELELPDIFCVR